MNFNVTRTGFVPAIESAEVFHFALSNFRVWVVLYITLATISVELFASSERDEIREYVRTLARTDQRSLSVCPPVVRSEIICETLRWSYQPQLDFHSELDRAKSRFFCLLAFSLALRLWSLELVSAPPMAGTPLGAVVRNNDFDTLSAAKSSSSPSIDSIRATDATPNCWTPGSGDLRQNYTDWLQYSIVEYVRSRELTCAADALQFSGNGGLCTGFHIAGRYDALSTLRFHRDFIRRCRLVARFFECYKFSIISSK